MTKKAIKNEGIVPQIGSIIMILLSLNTENDLSFLITGILVLIYSFFRLRGNKPYSYSPSGVFRICFGFVLTYILFKYSLQIQTVAIIASAVGINYYSLINGFLPDGSSFKIKNK